ncbi:hypothetical protein [Cerasicoccus frondis]|uniref:hypothetical protein n=1 Tax=Cerasicoccus frondis TaxID=490090 RepID=UPI002852C653|nr:hypothetical protein [Cerasicoccus frondis]
MKIDIPANTATAKRLEAYQAAGGDVLDVLEVGLDQMDSGLGLNSIDDLKAHLEPLLDQKTVPFDPAALHEEFKAKRAK